MKNHLRSPCGFTLIECLIALAIIAITLSIAMPTFNVIEKYRVENNARAVVSALMFARTTAIQEGESVFICPAKNSNSCDKSWSDKILVYRNNDKDRNLGSGDDIVRVFDLANGSSFIRWGSFQNKHYLELLPSGMTNFQNGTFTVCGKSKDVKTAIPVIVNVAGRPYFGLDKNNDGIAEYSSGKPVNCG